MSDEKRGSSFSKGQVSLPRSGRDATALSFLTPARGEQVPAGAQETSILTRPCHQPGPISGPVSSHGHLPPPGLICDHTSLAWGPHSPAC